MPAKTESLAKVAELIAKGFDSTWTWEKMAQEIFQLEGLTVGERGKEIAEHAAKVLRGFYPNRQSVWDSYFTAVDEAGRALEYEHIIALIKFEVEYTLAKRPVPPQAPPKEKKERKKKEGAAAEGDGPPAPPAPPTPGAPPPAPPAPPSPPPPPG